jgi:putative sterol carrier protein
MNRELIKNIFEKMIPDIAKKNPGVEIPAAGSFQIELTGGDGGTWTIDTKEGLKVVRGTSHEPTCTIKMAAEDFVRLIQKDEMDWALAYMGGKIKVNGDLSAGQKVAKLLVNNFRAIRAELKQGLDELNP